MDIEYGIPLRDILISMSCSIFIFSIVQKADLPYYKHTFYPLASLFDILQR
ncbi:hypothetical protein MYP_2906 [Sporocytophaga myxococcoides]|uniref:Uncharacterized protein n=1 Tax=Sporocytophaga myxococcoides TaxID=153721 RepID=A0A098LGT1_9BACT|nr:hypothetical protein MYP_2906 [Sporocytophaga myxococcoides]